MAKMRESGYSLDVAIFHFFIGAIYALASPFFAFGIVEPWLSVIQMTSPEAPIAIRPVLSVGCLMAAVLCGGLGVAFCTDAVKNSRLWREHIQK